MNLTALDWAIVAALLSLLVGVAAATRRYTRSVTDFLSADRCAGRYLLTLSEGLTALGLVGTVANFEKFYKAGFAASWWGLMLAPVGMLVALSGWVNYRYRETRALTMAEFFERRYSKNFRVFAGILAWVSGVLNYGVFPGVTARFLVYFGGFPPTLHIGALSIPTIAVVMLLMLTITLTLTLSGGMITVMITDFVQAQFINIVFILIAFVLAARFAWPDVGATLLAAPPQKSLVDPFDQSGIADFNAWFFFIFAFKLVYNRLGWQGTQGFNAAAKSPHEAKMAGILAEWRGGVTYLVISLLPIAAYVLLHNAQYAGAAQTINSTLATIPEEQIRAQMTVPVAMIQMLPPGVVGLLCAALIAGTIGTDTTYLHSWGSIFIQDVYLPLRSRRNPRLAETPLSPVEHVRLLCLSILSVAAFAFVFSLVFPLRDYILMYWLVTGAIYLGGSGAVIIGGLYWKRGTTKGAWWAMGVGSTLATSGALLTALWPVIPPLARLAPAFPINGAWMAFTASCSAVVTYIVVSLLTAREDFNMDRLLHRGGWRVPGASVAADAQAARSLAALPGALATPRTLLRRLGVTEEFSAGDRVIYLGKIAWTTFWIAVFIIGTIGGLSGRITPPMWLSWWRFTIILGLTVGSITVVWFLIGGLHDLRELFRRLNARDAEARRAMLAPDGLPFTDDLTITAGEPGFGAEPAVGPKPTAGTPA